MPDRQSARAILVRFRVGYKPEPSDRDDALGNAAVILAAGAVAVTGTPWPDLVVAVVIAGLFLHSAWDIVRDGMAELREQATAPAVS